MSIQSHDADGHDPASWVSPIFATGLIGRKSASEALVQWPSEQVRERDTYVVTQIVEGVPVLKLIGRQSLEARDEDV